MDTEDDSITQWRKNKRVISAAWEGDTVDEDYPQPVPVDDPFGVEARVQHPFGEEEEPEWFTRLYAAPQHKPGDRVTINVRPECETHSRMKLVGELEFYEKISGHSGKVVENHTTDPQTRPYKEGHTVKVMLDDPPEIEHTQYGKRPYYGGLFLPHELIPVQEKENDHALLEVDESSGY